MKNEELIEKIPEIQAKIQEIYKGTGFDGTFKDTDWLNSPGLAADASPTAVRDFLENLIADAQETQGDCTILQEGARTLLRTYFLTPAEAETLQQRKEIMQAAFQKIQEALNPLISDLQVFTRSTREVLENAPEDAEVANALIKECLITVSSALTHAAEQLAWKTLDQ
jgi:hypothetical protein